MTICYLRPPFLPTMSFVSRALANPTTFSKTFSSTFGLPSGWPIASGPGYRATSLNADAFGSIAVKNDGSNHYGSGTATSNSSIKNHLFMDKTNWKQHDTMLDGF